jgi:hypothetical protein
VFELQFLAEEIVDLTARYSYWDDADCRRTGGVARARRRDTRDEFIEVYGWKTARSRRLAAENTARYVVDATRRAFAADDEETRMKALLELRQVGLLTASALLPFGFADESPTSTCVRCSRSVSSGGRCAR